MQDLDTQVNLWAALESAEKLAVLKEKVVDTDEVLTTLIIVMEEDRGNIQPGDCDLYWERVKVARRNRNLKQVAKTLKETLAELPTSKKRVESLARMYTGISRS